MSCLGPIYSSYGLDVYAASRRRLASALGFALAMLAAGVRLGKRVHAQRPVPGRKLALVIGNSTYRMAPLKSPGNDTQAVAAALTNMGFEVTLRENASLRDMIETMRLFSVQAQSAKVRLLFYAGHGLQVRGRNYLLPVDTDLESEDDVVSRGADVNDLLDRLGRLKGGINILILDACRNNLFSGGGAIGQDSRGLRFRGATQAGLAPIDAPLGSMAPFRRHWAALRSTTLGAATASTPSTSSLACRRRVCRSSRFSSRFTWAWRERPHAFRFHWRVPA